jgi:hypothetical protein
MAQMRAPLLFSHGVLMAQWRTFPCPSFGHPFLTEKDQGDGARRKQAPRSRAELQKFPARSAARRRWRFRRGCETVADATWLQHAKNNIVRTGVYLMTSRYVFRCIRGWDVTYRVGLDSH